MGFSMKRDYIELKSVKVFANHGVLLEEKEKGQIFYIDVKMYLGLKEAGKNDNLNLSVNYADAAVFIKEYMENNTFDLIETVAFGLAENLLLKFDLIDEIDITVHKPEAPIPLEFGDVSVNINHKWNQVYLSVGSNIGDKEAYIESALCKLEENNRIKNVVCSKLITTKPYGGVEQDDFLNGAIGLQTLLSPNELLDYLHEIEQSANRERLVHWGPRTLDLDIVFYEDAVMLTDELKIPHTDMQNRQFVLEPLMELCPNYVNQITGETVYSMYKKLENL